uniref:Uncharacterized protein n=1 Tax=Plectus sambesii TaxID=2011161 RepID=A0A914VJL6_9BILA
METLGLCVVCNDKATGFHYSVESCNGCKTFFRRTVVNDQRFKCQGNGKCVIDKSVRCACRHCRFQKCLRVGMDRSSIQSDRDKIGFTKRRRKDEDYSHRNAAVAQGGTPCERSPCDNLPITSPSFDLNGELETLYELEQRCSRVRLSTIELKGALKDAVFKTDSILNDHQLIDNCQPIPKVTDLRRGTREEVAYWHRRDIMLMIEWAKAQPLFLEMSDDEKLILLRNSSISYMMLQQTFYSDDYGPDMMVLPSGAYVHRAPKIPVFRPLMKRMMDQLMLPMRKWQMDPIEYTAVKSIIFWNSNLPGLTPSSKGKIKETRNSLLNALHTRISSQNVDPRKAAERFGRMLLLAPQLSSMTVISMENMQLATFFDLANFDNFYKELMIDDDPTNRSDDHYD